MHNRNNLKTVQLLTGIAIGFSASVSYLICSVYFF